MGSFRCEQAARLGEDDPCRGNHRATGLAAHLQSQLDAYLHAKVQVKNALLARRQRIRRKGSLWAEAACAVGIVSDSSRNSPNRAIQRESCCTFHYSFSA